MAVLHLNRFIQEMEEAGKDIDATVEKVQRRAALGIHDKLIRRTPVDTGRARAAWMLTQDRPSSEIPPEGNYSEANARDRQRAAKGVKAFSRTWITNNVPYIEELNGGRSNQADAGFVEAAVDLEEAELEAYIDGRGR